jgi:hypothetical protein
MRLRQLVAWEAAWCHGRVVASGHTHIYVCIQVYMFVYIFIYTNICTHTHKYIYIFLGFTSSDVSLTIVHQHP